MHNKCNMLDSSPQTIPFPRSKSVEKLSSTKLIPGTKNVGNAGLMDKVLHDQAPANLL